MSLISGYLDAATHQLEKGGGDETQFELVVLPPDLCF